MLCLSPHLDDAVLSAGGVLLGAARAGRRVVVATLCTRDAPPEPELSELARQLHRAWAGSEPPSLVRRREDARACDLLGVEARHLDLADAIYRQGAAREHYSSFEELFPEQIPVWDDGFASRVAACVRALLEELQPACVLGPLALGGHVDHQQVARVVHALEGSSGVPIYYYEDQPYAAGLYGPRFDPPARRDLPQRCALHALVRAIDFVRKRDAILCYGSQLPELFGAEPDGGLDRLEAYSCSLDPSSSAAERLWVAPGECASADCLG